MPSPNSTTVRHDPAAVVPPHDLLAEPADPRKRAPKGLDPGRHRPHVVDHNARDPIRREERIDDRCAGTPHAAE